MSQQDAGIQLTGLAQQVLVVDWESSIPMSRAVRRDPRMPKLTEVPGFTNWLREGWGDADRTPHLEDGAVAAAAAHRHRLSEALPGRTLVITAGRAQLRVGDTFFEFRADSDFLWLVGHSVEDGVLVMSPVAGGHEATLYLTPPARPGDTAFHADANHGELWVGPLPGLAELEPALQLHTAPLSELNVADDALVAGAPVVGIGAGRALDGWARSGCLLG
ncbi:aminopeptidase P N-terminal domain-containing protein [Leucobacter coleopterorum]|uniref:aminopeptidase P N-terminal domain-containing protein n=1 Tax=Leucobacter coleopterorum TaxID=2714933 RepID=UPI00197E6125|nr:aminopeptidase P N-terminal domain-containing protein [Leucobacter coleopterorum]